MNSADVFIYKSSSFVTIFGDDDSHSKINWHQLVSALRSRKGNQRLAIAKEVVQNGLIDNVGSIVGKSQESGLLTLPKASYNVIWCDLCVRIADVDSCKKWQCISRSNNARWRTVWSKRLYCKSVHRICSVRTVVWQKESNEWLSNRFLTVLICPSCFAKALSWRLSPHKMVRGKIGSELRVSRMWQLWRKLIMLTSTKMMQSNLERDQFVNCWLLSSLSCLPSNWM